MGARLASAMIAILCACVAGWLAAHHPLQPVAMACACIFIATIAFARFRCWPLVVLPLLPLAGLAPWTGWLVVEEWDLLVLATAAGGYARLAAGLAGPPERDASPRLGVWLFLLAYAGLTLVAMVRGVADAGGWSWGWWQGYREPLNSVRLAKPVLEVMLLLPLWQALYRRGSSAATRTLLLGMVLLAFTAALPVWWERMAFPGLLDASTDYRATGLFWEMHVGGAALDAVLAMGAPFVLGGLLLAGRPRAWAGYAMVGAVVFYAALATFSRIVYLAVPAGLLLCGLLYLGQGRRLGREVARGLAQAGLLLLSVFAAAMWLFPTAGYRGLIALLGSFALLLLTRPQIGPDRNIVTRLVAGTLAVGLVLTLTFGVDKGAYLAFGSCWLIALIGFAWASRPTGRGLGMPLEVAGYVGSLAGLVAVAWHWGGPAALERAWPIAAVLLLLRLLARRSVWTTWPGGLQWPASVAMGAACLMAVVAVFGGGAYMGDRLTNVAQDSNDRQRHWHLLFDLLRTPDSRILGYGLGRVPTQLATAGVPEVSAGDVRLGTDADGSHLLMAAAMHVQGWGEMLRISQRVERPMPGTVKVRLRVRSPGPVPLHAEVCNKHLLYNGVCKDANLFVRPGSEGWQSVEFNLVGDDLPAGPWYAPRLVAFSLALDKPGARAEIDDVQLLDVAGHDLLSNGGFEEGLRRWFLSSDRHHMPWHAKNIVVHLWFEQGPLVCALLALAVLGLFLRLAGVVRLHPLMPATAGAIAGVMIVGIVDSVFDVPRAAFLALWLLSVGLGLRAAPKQAL